MKLIDMRSGVSATSVVKLSPPNHININGRGNKADYPEGFLLFERTDGDLESEWRGVINDV